MQQLVLVTGGAGFIGSHLCERLVALGYRVISLDNYSTGTVGNHVAGVEYRKGDTKHIADLIPESPDSLYHLGEYPRVEQSFADIEAVLDSNVSGMNAVLEFWKRKRPKLIYTGSSTKYADDDTEGRYKSPYACTKATNTESVVRYGEWYDLPYAITYFYNVYGPRERADLHTGTLVGIFAEKYRRGELLGVRMPGTQKRNFTHVYDIVTGLLLVGEQGHGDEYDLGHPNAYSILEVAEMFGGKVEMLEGRVGDRNHPGITSDRASRELGWKPVHTLPEYINTIKQEMERG